MARRRRSTPGMTRRRPRRRRRRCSERATYIKLLINYPGSSVLHVLFLHPCFLPSRLAIDSLHYRRDDDDDFGVVLRLSLTRARPLMAHLFQDCRPFPPLLASIEFGRSGEEEPRINNYSQRPAYVNFPDLRPRSPSRRAHPRACYSTSLGA